MFASDTESNMKTMNRKKKSRPFREWLDEQKMSVPAFVDEAVRRGVKTAKVNSLYKAARGSVPRNRVLYEEAFPGIRF
jgi:hypothetical protein